MAINFPSSPTNGQSFTANGTTWVWDTRSWNIQGSAGTSGGSGTVSARNRLINGSMLIDQRNAGNSQTVTAGAALAYTVDRWYAYCTGANVTGQQVAGAYANQKRYQFTGAASVTAIGFGQRIEQANCADLANSTATLSVDLANSLLTSVTWTAYYANTANTFGTLASLTRTQIATGTFTVTSTVTRYNTQISIPSGATTGIEIVFTVGAQTSGTWTIGNVQLESGSSANAFEFRHFEQELGHCHRNFETNYDYGVVPGSVISGFSGCEFMYGTGQMRFTQMFIIPKLFSPTVTLYDNAGSSGKLNYYSGGWYTGLTPGAIYTTKKYFGAHYYGSVSEIVGYWTVESEL